MSEWKSQQLQRSGGDSLIRLHFYPATHVDCWDLISCFDMRKKKLLDDHATSSPCALQEELSSFLFSFQWLWLQFPALGDYLTCFLSIFCLIYSCQFFRMAVEAMPLTIRIISHTAYLLLLSLCFTWTAASCVRLDVFICPKCFHLSGFGLDALPFPFIFSSFVPLPLFKVYDLSFSFLSPFLFFFFKWAASASLTELLQLPQQSYCQPGSSAISESVSHMGGLDCGPRLSDSTANDAQQIHTTRGQRQDCQK